MYPLNEAHYGWKNAGEHFTEEERTFVLQNADFFFFLFGHWFNYSYVPIRCICKDLTTMKRAYRKMSNKTYIKHQSGKMNEVQRMTKRANIRDYYLVEDN